MQEYEEIEALLRRLSEQVKQGEREDIAKPKQMLRDSAEKIGKAASGSWLGYHARVYYDQLSPPPPGRYFDKEWGLRHPLGRPVSAGFGEFRDEDIQTAIRLKAGSPKLLAAKKAAEKAEGVFDVVKEEALAILQASLASNPDPVIEAVVAETKSVKLYSAHDFVNYVKPRGTLSTRDSIVAGQGLQAPPHIKIQAEIFELDAPFTACEALAKALRPAALHLTRISKKLGEPHSMKNNELSKSRIFIGHGQSAVWKDLKDFVQDRLHLAWDEFNREAAAGKTTIQRLSEMLDSAGFAFLVMTGEDEQANGEIIARQNVIHEVGLFQGRLGFTKAIVLLEDGCDEFSNIQGLSQIRFPKGRVGAAFEDIRKVLEREGLIPSSHPALVAEVKKRRRIL